MSDASMRKRITLAEVIVVVAVIVVAIALILPMVHQARESSRRTMCRNNLKRIGLAMLSYHDAHRVFPPGITSTNFLGTTRSCEYVASPIGACEPDNAGLSQSSAFMMILPFMDQ